MAQMKITPLSQSMAVRLFLLLFSIYLLTYTPRINSSDGLAMFATAESLVRRGALDIEQLRWMDLQQGTFGLDGLLYSRKGIGVPLGLLPLTWLGAAIPWFGLVTTSLLFNAIVTALTAVLLMAYVQRLGFEPRTGLMVALTFGLTTLAWPYAKSLFSDPFSGLLLLGAAYGLRKYRQTEASRFIFLAGFCLAWNVATRYAEAIFIPVFAFWLFQSKIQNLKSKILLVFLAPLAMTMLALATFNYTRYGDLFNTGYLPNETFSGDLWTGVMGQLISPGRGLLLYCPVLWLSFWGIRPLWQRSRAETGLALSIIFIHLFVYGKWFMWHGGYAWGPRFLIPTLPFWAIFLAPVVESYPLKWSYIFLAGLGFIFQLLSITTDFALFQGLLLDTGLPLFAPQTFFEWQYSPLLKGWRFITPQNLDVAWAWAGQFNMLLLGLLVSNIILAGFWLMKKRATKLWLASPILTLLTVLFLLNHAHTLPLQFPPAKPGFKQAITMLNNEALHSDIILVNQPELTMDFAEQYKGPAAVSIWQSGGFPLPAALQQRLTNEIQSNPLIMVKYLWWLPNGLAPEKSAVEQILLAKGFRVREDHFEGQRLVLFAFSSNLSPKNLSIQPWQAQSATIQLLSLHHSFLAPHSSFLLEFEWQTDAPLTENYRLFIKLLNQQNEGIAQADGQPVNWTRPTSTWQVGETLIDRYAIRLPANISPGDYQVQLGWYRPENGQRLLLPNGQDMLQFQVVVNK